MPDYVRQMPTAEAQSTEPTDNERVQAINECDEREATELGQLNTVTQIQQDDNGITKADATRHRRLSKFDGSRQWWKHHIQLHVPHAACRDHLGMSCPICLISTFGFSFGCLMRVEMHTDPRQANERTFLSYQRTSLALSMLGIVTAQLFSLQHSQHPDPIFGYHALGKPLATLFQAAAIVVILIGGHRFWRQQMNIARGTVWAGGWEIYTIMAFILLVSFDSSLLSVALI